MFGICYDSIDSSINFQELINNLRIINRLYSKKSFLIFYDDLLQDLLDDTLLIRLSNRLEFSIAFEIADLLGKSKTPIITKFAHFVICQETKKNSLAFELLSKHFGQYFDYPSIALFACQQNQIELSEKSPRNQNINSK
jgi:hypothetical protein